MDSESVFEKLGTGPFQVLIILACSITAFIPASWHMISIIWIAPETPHYCKTPANSSLATWLPVHSDGKFESCFMYKNLSINNETVPCTNGWEYDEEETGPSIISKYDLVCDRKSFPAFSQSLLFVGVMIGAVVFSFLSDKYGRKPVLLITLFLISLVGVLTVISPSLELFLVLRFFTGTLQQGIFLVGVVLICEMSSSQQRNITGLLDSIVWGVGTSILPLIAYFCHSWIHFELFISIYGFLCLPLFLWIPETLPWLLVNNKISQAQAVVKKMAKLNRVEIPDTIFDERKLDVLHVGEIHPNNKYDEQKIEKSLLDTKSPKADKDNTLETEVPVHKLFTNLLLLKTVVLCSTIGFILNVCFYGISLSSTSLFGNRFLNGFLDAIVLVPAGFLISVLLRYFGRRKPLSASYFLAFLTFLFRLIIILAIEKSYISQTFDKILGILGKFGIAGANSIIQFFMTELFPTNLRNQALGICSAIAKLGSILAAYSIIMMQRDVAGFFSMMAVLLLLASILVFILPETDKLPMPNNIADIKNLHRRKNIRV